MCPLISLIINQIIDYQIDHFVILQCIEHFEMITILRMQ